MRSGQVSEHFIVNQALTLIEAQMLNLQLSTQLLPIRSYREFFFCQPGPIPSLKIIPKLM